MRQPAHTITLEPWRDSGIGVRFAIQTMLFTLWPLKPDDRMTALISVLSDAVLDVAENDDQIDAIMDIVRMQLRIGLADLPRTRVR